MEEPNLNSILLDHLVALYGETDGRAVFDRLRVLSHAPQREEGAGLRGEVSEKDSILITYGDQLRERDTLPLQTLADFCDRHLAGLISSIHILPFFPYSSDDGFSVIDYRAVDPALGSWEDVAKIGRSFRLMFDAVINHVSAESAWFQAFLRDDPKYRNYFIVVEGDPDLSRVVRPRALPLLTRFTTPSGEKKVWTTFSEDQIDLNYRQSEVLLEIVDLLLFYVSRGAEFVRLDAIAYLWKETGTPCIHLPQTHRIIQLLRAVLDEVAPRVMLITETNVPHADNISYFGDGANEAQMVYNFALPPLVLHTLRVGNVRALSRWAARLTLPSKRVTFFNFLASHDGIGLNPVRGILSDAEIEALVRQVIAHGGLVSHKHNLDGTQSPYELNINYFDALSDPNGQPPGLPLQVDRFMSAQAIMLSLVGVPGIYFHSLFGSRGWPEGVKETGHNRTINRRKFDRAEVERELADPTSLRHQVFTRTVQLLKARAASPAFHPHGSQQVINYGDSLFTLLRLSPDGDERVLCVQNVSSQPQSMAFDFDEVSGLLPKDSGLADLITGQRFKRERRGALRLRPYQTLWLV